MVTFLLKKVYVSLKNGKKWQKSAKNILKIVEFYKVLVYNNVSAKAHT